MAHQGWMLAALLLGAPAAAGIVEFQGHSLETGAVEGAHRLLSMQGAPYSVPASTAQTIGKAQACLSRADSGVGVVSVDATGGRLRAIGRTPYQHDGQPRLLRSRWALEATGGSFRITFTDLADIRQAGGDELYAPLAFGSESGWQEALGAVIAVETALLDCMYR